MLEEQRSADRRRALALNFCLATVAAVVIFHVYAFVLIWRTFGPRRASITDITRVSGVSFPVGATLRRGANRTVHEIEMYAEVEMSGGDARRFVDGLPDWMGSLAGISADDRGRIIHRALPSDWYPTVPAPALQLYWGLRPTSPCVQVTVLVWPAAGTRKVALVSVQ